MGDGKKFLIVRIQTSVRLQRLRELVLLRFIPLFKRIPISDLNLHYN